jgi:hypothetical protein
MTILTQGSHVSVEDGLCLLEATAFLAGEPHSDHPVCVSPVLAAFGRGLNDAPWSSNEARTQHLEPLIPLLIGTAGKTDEQAVAERLVRWSIRVAVPLALRASGLDAEAVKLESLSPTATMSELKVAAYAAAANYANAAYAAYAAYAANAAYAAYAAAAVVAAADAAYAAYAAAAAAKSDEVLILAAAELKAILAAAELKAILAATP